jgi:hypothetical protein
LLLISDPKNLEEKWQSENTMCLGELWLEMFRFYALDFDILERVVCIQQSSPDLRIGSMKKGIGRRIAIRGVCSIFFCIGNISLHFHPPAPHTFPFPLPVGNIRNSQSVKWLLSFV